jgi:PAS domain S-box-containing protein
MESIGNNLLDDPSIAGIIVNSRDITERVEAEEAYRNLVENSLQGIVIQQDDRIVFANRAAAEMIGYSIDELKSFDMDNVRDLIHPDDVELVWERWMRRRAGVSQPLHSEFRLVRKDGATRWIETFAAAIEHRRRPAVQVVYIDVTDRRRAQEDARLRQQELAHVLRRRTMGEMAAVLAHEVNQPLAAIINYAHGCTERLRTGTGTADRLLDALDEIKGQALRAGAIIRRLRGFVRKGELHRVQLQLNSLVDEVIKFVAPEAQVRGVNLLVDLARDLPPLEVDALQIEQVILNLLRNALEAIYESPGERPLLAIRTGAVDEGIELAVRDSGAGLHPAIAAEIFEPFVTSKQDGLGMGLSICRSIVDAHGGRLWHTRNADRGMTFRFILPLSVPPQE